MITHVLLLIDMCIVANIFADLQILLIIQYIRLHDNFDHRIPRNRLWNIRTYIINSLNFIIIPLIWIIITHNQEYKNPLNIKIPSHSNYSRLHYSYSMNHNQFTQTLLYIKTYTLQTYSHE